jgi:hypothetical protein
MYEGCLEIWGKLGRNAFLILYGLLVCLRLRECLLRAMPSTNSNACESVKFARGPGLYPMVTYVRLHFLLDTQHYTIILRNQVP